ncbi:MAG TPA: sigma-70 family RNA polymerase sigma factor [Sandaracinaceae bacterium]
MIDDTTSERDEGAVREPDADLDLLERWKRGDLRAGSALFERHFESVYRFFVHRAPSHATDLVQRTFLSCVEARDRFRGTSSFRTFLFAIARNELLVWLRRRQRDAVDEGGSSVADRAPSPSTQMHRRFEHRVLLEALRAIPLDLQIALELHYWEQMSVAEIAEVMRVPVGTAKSRLRRAREALVEAIRALEEDPAKLGSTLASLDQWPRRARGARSGGRGAPRSRAGRSGAS